METLDKHFRTLTLAAFKSHGFATADLLAHWPELVGEKMAALTHPDRIKWPKDKEGGATLHLTCAAGRALDVQYAAPQIMERLNQYLGYAAIAKIKISSDSQLQEPKLEPPQKSAPSPNMMRPVSAVADPDLKAALARLAQGIAADSARSPQGK